LLEAKSSAGAARGEATTRRRGGHDDKLCLLREVEAEIFVGNRSGSATRPARGAMAAAASFHERLKAVPGLKAALVSDPEGVVLLQAGDAAHDEAMKKYAATFLLTAERASKLHLGKNKTLTALYGV